MKNKESELITYDAALLVFAIVAGWLIVFQSGLF